ncbi:PAS domain S-box protein [Chryseolinea sp. T2]|uniref:PAS domain-containing protein n=1 Tax=Chryseolinea sp. T2 TaxID=3129255 RepID=UPI0030780E00
MEKDIPAGENIHFNASFVEAVLHSSIVSRTDRFGKITYVNKALEAISQYTNRELIGKEFRIVSSGTHSPEFWSDMWSTIAGGNSWHGEICNRAKDGSFFWVDMFIYPYHNTNGELVEFVSIGHDITQSKSQQEALTKSEVHMRAIVNSTSDIYFLLSPEAKLLNINQAGQKNLAEYWDARASENYEAALLKALNTHPESWNDFRRALAGEIVELEVKLTRLDGERIWHHVRHLPAYGDDHIIIGVSIVLTNIHNRKVQELKLRESEIRYRSIFNSTNDAFFLIGPDLQLLAYNKLALKLLGGHPNPEDVREAFFRLWRMQEGSQERLRRALNGEIVELEKVSTHFDGSKAWDFVRYMPAYDDNNAIIGVSLSVTDIQARKTQEILLQESKDHYRAILNSTSDVYFLVSPNLKLLATNSTGDESLERIVKTYKLADKQTAFENIFKLQEVSPEFFQRALAGEVVESEHQVTRYDGTKVWYYHRYLPVLNDAKESIGVSISMTNIHTRKMQELEIEAKNQALINIAWSHSHEMRRPVASILGLIQLKKAEKAMITDEEFMFHLSTMVNELDLFIRKNVERTYLASQ